MRDKASNPPGKSPCPDCLWLMSPEPTLDALDMRWIWRHCTLDMETLHMREPETHTE